MNSDTSTHEHVFLPLIARAQLVSCGLVLTAAMGFAALGAIDFSTLRALLGA